MRIFIVVTHLLGAGHLRRALNLAQAFSDADHNVTLVSGGTPIPQFSATGVSFVQLPSVKSDGVSFQRLLQPDGSVVTEAYLASRQMQLIDLLHEQRPQAIITELFPFGRRVLKAEFQELLSVSAALPERPLILSSIRDILSPPSTRVKADETSQLVHDYYDAVLVHSDELTTPLRLSWPVTAEMSQKLHYTGYVAQPFSETCTESGGRKEIVVSAGGGSVGGRLFETAIAAANLSNDFSWRLLIGGSDAVAEVDRLRSSVSSSQAVIVEPAREDFRTLLQQAECSISMCGYNTAVDLLQTGTPGVLVPFDAGGETEQSLRAMSLSKNAAFRTILSNELTPKILLEAVAEVRQAGRFRSDHVGFNGALESVRITEALLNGRHGQ